MTRARVISRTVWALGAVSLLTDLSTDMIFPLLPTFLIGVLGASAVGLGLIEGVAESTAAFLKLASGRLADRTGRPRPLVLAGYSLSSVSKPLMALAMSPWHVLGLRFADRLGKGVRSAPRDLMLASEASPQSRGTVFGLHRAMDTLGAVLGPLVAFLILLALPGRYRVLFALAAIPAALSIVILLLFVREHSIRDSESVLSAATPGIVEAHQLGRGFRRLMVIVAVFTLGNSSDAFLLLKAASVGIDAGMLPLLWLALNVTHVGVSWVAGSASDRIGREWVIGTGFVLYAAVYLWVGLADRSWEIWCAFGLYGAYYGLTDGVLRAAIADVAPAGLRGTAYGIYHALSGIGLLVASITAGWLWEYVAPAAPFVIGSVLALLAGFLTLYWRPSAGSSS